MAIVLAAYQLLGALLIGNFVGWRKIVHNSSSVLNLTLSFGDFREILKRGTCLGNMNFRWNRIDCRPEIVFGHEIQEMKELFLGGETSFLVRKKRVPEIIAISISLSRSRKPVIKLVRSILPRPMLRVLAEGRLKYRSRPRHSLACTDLVTIYALINWALARKTEGTIFN